MWSYYVPTLLHMDEIFVDGDGDGYVEKLRNTHSAWKPALNSQCLELSRQNADIYTTSKQLTQLSKYVCLALYTFNYDSAPNLAAAFNGLLSALCKSKNVRTLRSILIDGWGRDPNLPKAREVFREKIDVDCNHDIVTYGIVVEVLFRAGRVKMLNGIRANVVVYNALIDAFCKANKFKNVHRVSNDTNSKGLPQETEEVFSVFHKVWKYMKLKQFVPSMHTSKYW
ncbi:hypothetical protein DVH24_039521 [Malus domestica]|uniref:Uncharacterized protein n=1 Tax=Malus domestica TaxID=3750 RepID=A0A498I0Q1_MALDO|nr:hypothetical protein DVH24_039521 [Malus domestica]